MQKIKRIFTPFFIKISLYLCTENSRSTVMKRIEKDGFIDLVAETIADRVKEHLNGSQSESSQPSSRGAQYMTVKDVCDLLHISKATLYRHRDAGYLTPSTYVGRKPLFSRDDIDIYLGHFN